MSSPSDSADPAQAAPAERVATDPSPATPESTGSVGDTAEERRRAPIRIGTQRYGVKPPPAVPKPVLALPPRPVTGGTQETTVAETLSAAPASEPPAPVSGAPVPVAGEPGPLVASDSPAAEAAHAAPVSSAPAAAPPVPAGTKPKRVPVAEPTRTTRVEPPNIRSSLSPELEAEFLEALGDQSLDEIIAADPDKKAELELESRHRAKVIAVHRDNVFFELPVPQQGVVQLKNFAAPPEPGSLFDVMVARFNAAEGLYELLLPGGAVDVADWSEVAEGMVVEARVTGHNKGGLECEVNKLRGFIPASQVSMYRVEDLSQFVGQSFACVITEANPEKRNLVLSRRAILEREKAEAKENILASLEVGQIREGTVRSLQNFGAFVDLGGVDGLIHISQLSWDRLKHADEALQLGQRVKVKIVKIDPQTGKIGLGFRDLAENPWANVARDFPARSRVPGTVSKIMDFGAFVRLAPGVEGLVHISELSHKRVFRVTDVLSEGQQIEVQVQSVDLEQQRISLSLKALEARAVPEAKPEEPEEPETPRPAPKPRKVPLKGGTGGTTSIGEKFGLKW